MDEKEEGMNFADRLLRFLDELLEMWWNKLDKVEGWSKYVWLRTMIGEGEYFRKVLQEVKGEGFWVEVRERIKK